MLLTFGALFVTSLKQMYQEGILDWTSPLLPLFGTFSFMFIGGCLWKQQHRTPRLLESVKENGSSRRTRRRRTLLLKPITLAEISPDQRKRNIVVVGLASAGKTAFLQRLLHASNPSSRVSNDPEPTIGVRMTSVELRGLRETYYEVGGSETTRMFAKEFLHMAHLVVFVVDASAEESVMEEAREYYQFVSKETDYTGPVVVIANKQDLPNARAVREVYEALGICDKDDVYLLPARCAPKTHIENNEGDHLAVVERAEKPADLSDSRYYGLIENVLYRTFGD